MAKNSASGNRLISNNKKAYFDYFIEEKYEAGMVLCGTEVKSVRAGKCSIKESYIQIQNGEVYVINMNITPYEKGNIFNKDPLRTRRLLLHKTKLNRKNVTRSNKPINWKIRKIRKLRLFQKYTGINTYQKRTIRNKRTK